jgi:ComF family protein
VFPVDRLLQNLKYGGQLAVAAWAAESLAAAIGNPLSVAVASTGRDADPAYPDAIVPLPLAASRQRERGFNQAHEIARVVARRLGLRIVTPLARVRAVAPQTSLPLADRVANVRGVFRCSETVRGRRIALVDDVMTTGATLAEAARTVQAAGATSVRCWVVARTPHSG